MKKSFYICLASLLLVSPAIHSQSSEQISKLLETPRASVAQASYIAAVYKDLIPDSSQNSGFSTEGSSSDSELQAFQALKDKGYFSSSVSADDQITLDQACFTYAKVLDIKGGLFYTLFPSKRYAFKEFKAKNLIPPTADPSTKMSGRDTLDLFNSAMNFAEGASKW